jgi:hypothetical protein
MKEMTVIDQWQILKDDNKRLRDESWTLTAQVETMAITIDDLKEQLACAVENVEGFERRALKAERDSAELKLMKDYMGVAYPIFKSSLEKCVAEEKTEP